MKNATALRARGGEFEAERLRKISRMEGWHFWFTARQTLLNRLVGAYLEGETDPLLDLGCGTGFVMRKLEGKHRVLGIDQRPEGLTVFGRETGCWAAQAAGYSIPAKSSAFAGILLLDVLEHADDDRLMKEVARLLRPGGYVLISVPAHAWLWSSRDTDAGHLRRYSRRDLKDLLDRNGFHMEELRYYQCFLFPVMIGSRLLGKSRPGIQRVEEAIPWWINKVLYAINLAEVRLGEFIPWPWGSSLIAVARRQS